MAHRLGPCDDVPAMRTLALVTTIFAVTSPAHAGRVTDALGAPIRKLFQRLAAKKQDRVFHAGGVVYRGTIRDAQGERPAIVRLSRGAGKPADQSDILGVAIKDTLAGAEQDYLLVSAKAQTGFRARLAKFTGQFAGQSISSLTSYRKDGLVGPITGELPATFRTPLDVDAPGVGPARQSFQLTLHQQAFFRTRASTAIADVTVHFDEPMAPSEIAGLRMSPWHEGGGVHPVGFINWTRKFAYPGSQAGRGLPAEK